MSADHFSNHTGQRSAPKGCWRAGCNRQGSEQANGRFYCPAHFTPRLTVPDFEHVQVARRLMSPGGGRLTLSDVAGRLGFQRSALDQALWRYLGRAK